MRTRIAAALLMLAASQAHAKPTHQQALIRYFGPHLPESLHACTTCHARGEDEVLDLGARKEHNPFGSRLAKLRRELEATNKPSDIPARLSAVMSEDADGDGVSNLLEMLSGTAPGDATRKPVDAVLKTSISAVPAFERYRERAAWNSLSVVARPDVPTLKDDWIRNPIDAFIRKSQLDEGLTPRPEADRRTLLRRVTLDLTGMPPTVQEIEAFLADTSDSAYEKVVDRLLGSKAHAERWARHWMDVWRYSDWAGFGNQLRVSQKHIWQWRDWIVESLEADTGYDQMLRLMLAADETDPLDEGKLRATGFLVRNYNLLSREVWLQDSVEQTFAAFQASTVGCARCHDHMYDPISQEEYYRLRAVFAPHNVRVDRAIGAASADVMGLPRAYDAKLDEVVKLLIRGDDRQPHGEPLAPGAIAAFGYSLPVPKSITLPRFSSKPELRPEYAKEAVDAATKAVEHANTSVMRVSIGRVFSTLGSRPILIASMMSASDHTEKLARLDSEIAMIRAERVVGQIRLESQDVPDPTKLLAQNVLDRQLAYGLAKRARIVADSPVAAKNADAYAKLAIAEEKARRDLDRPATPNYIARVVPTYPASSSGRRSALAEWMTDRRNPRTARVAVNHIWLRHYGEALVPSVADFGKNGRLPTHPALLDWLAAEFIDSGYSMRRVHRLIVTSATYRQSSTPDAKMATLDKDNLFYWRFAPRRLEGEAVRDSLLSVSGLLDAKAGGPDIDQNTAMTVPRRSIYFRHAAEKEAEFLKLFDGPLRRRMLREAALGRAAAGVGDVQLTPGLAGRAEARPRNIGRREIGPRFRGPRVRGDIGQAARSRGVRTRTRSPASARPDSPQRKTGRCPPRSPAPRPRAACAGEPDARPAQPSRIHHHPLTRGRT